MNQWLKLTRRDGRIIHCNMAHALTMSEMTTEAATSIYFEPENFVVVVEEKPDKIMQLLEGRR